MTDSTDHPDLVVEFRLEPVDNDSGDALCRNYVCVDVRSRTTLVEYRRNTSSTVLSFVFEHDMNINNFLRVAQVAPIGGYVSKQRELKVPNSRAKAMPENTTVLYLPPCGEIERAIDAKLDSVLGDNIAFVHGANEHQDTSDSNVVIRVLKSKIRQIVKSLLEQTRIDVVQSQSILAGISSIQDADERGGHYYFVERLGNPVLRLNKESVGTVLRNFVLSGIITPDYPESEEFSDDTGKRDYFECIADILDPTWPDRYQYLVPREHPAESIEPSNIPTLSEVKLRGIRTVKQVDMSDGALDDWWARNVIGRQSIALHDSFD